MEANLPHNWAARDYQKPLCDYLDAGGKHAEVIWHRRAGKDEVALHHAACQMADREATYWHMLPQYNQIRKAIWESINPHSGIRRIYEAFPPELFSHRDTDMFVRSRFNNSTWQCLGSDNYANAIGSPPAGITYSEWALANPSARGYLRPILAENNGYQLYITTPRGKNHAHRTYQAAKKTKGSFAQVLTVEDTGMLSAEQLVIELAEYIATYGEDFGRSLYEQEYYCSFDAAIIGAYYGSEFKLIDKEGRICSVPWQSGYKVYTAWDIGRTDDTAIWFYQIVGGELHIIDFHASNGKDPGFYAGQLLGREVAININYGKLGVEYGKTIDDIAHRQAYDYARLGLPHDAKAKTLAAQGKSTQEQLGKVFGWGKVSPTVSDLSFDDGIKAGRFALNRAYFDDNERVLEGIEALRQYQREWDDEKKMFKDNHLHNWCSHPADAWRYLGVDWQEAKPKPEDQPIKFPVQGTFNDMLNIVGKRRRGNDG